MAKTIGYLACAGVALSCLSTAATSDDVLSTKQQTFTVKYKDGSIERHVVRYQAMYSMSQNETGRASEPLKGHPIDDRQCHWQIHTYVERDIGVLDHSGHVGWREDWRRIFDRPVVNRAPGLGIKTGLQGVNCGKASDQIARETNAAKSQVLAALPAMMADDRSAIEKEVKGDGQVIKVG